MCVYMYNMRTRSTLLGAPNSDACTSRVAPVFIAADRLAAFAWLAKACAVACAVFRDCFGSLSDFASLPESLSGGDRTA